MTRKISFAEEFNQNKSDEDDNTEDKSDEQDHDNEDNEDNEDEDDDDDEDDDEQLHTKLWGSHHVTHCGITMHENTFIFLQLSLVFVGFLLAGGGIFHRIEFPYEQERIDNARIDFKAHQKIILEMLNNHTSTGNETDAWEFYELLREHSTGFKSDDEEENQWGFKNAVIFSFTIITTIGYGTFSPETTQGRIFLIFYGLIGIPVAGISLGFIAQRVLYFFTLISQIGKDKAAAAFNEFDADNSGELEQDEFDEALKHLGIEMDETDFKRLWKEVDKDGGGQVDLEEFRSAVKTLDADLTEAAGKKNKMIITLVGIFLWLLIGVFMFKYTEEGWDYMHTIYFLFVSLTTIGLGDVVPNTILGEFFLVVFAMIGLGLVAVLITLLRQFMRELESNRRIFVKGKKDTKKKRKKLKEMDFFARMNKEELDRLIEKMDVLSFFPNSQIIKEGKVMDLFYILWSGSVTVSSHDGTINQVIESPSFLMESTILHNPNSPVAYATVHADDTVEILSFNRDEYESSLESNMVEDTEEDDRSIEIGIIPSTEMIQQDYHVDSIPEPEQLTIAFAI